jgi:hypothetical protein
MGGRVQSESAAVFIGMRSHVARSTISADGLGDDGDARSQRPAGEVFLAYPSELDVTLALFAPA